jgi:hypothetical protein
LPISIAFFYISLRFPNKQGLIIQIITFFSKSVVKHRPLPDVPAGPLWRITLVSRAFVYISFRVPSKEALPPGFPVGLLWAGMPISRAVLYISFWVPSKGALL